MDAPRLYLADCVGVIVLPISHIIIAFCNAIAINKEKINNNNNNKKF